MSTKLLSVVVIIMSSFFAASAQKVNNKIASDNYSWMPNAKEVMIEAVLVTDAGFPSKAYSVPTASETITTFQNWAGNNKSRFSSLVEGTAQAQRLSLIRENYYRLSADKQDAFKSFMANMEKYFSVQNTASGNTKKTYLLCEADFEKLQSIIK